MLKRKMACKFRRKFRHKLTYLTIIIVVILVWIIAPRSSDSENSVNNRVTKSNVEILHERMKARRRWIKAKFCDPKKKLAGVRKDLDFNNFIRPKFLQNFKNPCFIQNVTTDTGSRTELGCLPYFIVAGFPKTGTTDLWSRFENHPDIILRHVKEPMFFNKGKTLAGFKEGGEKYVTFYSKTTSVLQRHVCPAECSGPFPYFNGITGEASVDTIYDNAYWQQLPGNEGCTEPVVTNADYVRHINPDIKIIVMLRNPVERLYSDYIYESRFYGYDISQEDFHKSVQGAIANFTICVHHNNPRSCVYNRIVDSKKARLKIGIYHIYIEDWLAVFLPHNVLVIRAEDTLNEKKYEVYRQIFNFLEIRPFTREEELQIFSRGPINTRSKPEKDIGDMWPKTRELLTQFYKPYNEKLTLLLPGIDYNVNK